MAGKAVVEEDAQGGDRVDGHGPLTCVAVPSRQDKVAIVGALDQGSCATEVNSAHPLRHNFVNIMSGSSGHIYMHSRKSVPVQKPPESGVASWTTEFPYSLDSSQQLE